MPNVTERDFSKLAAAAAKDLVEQKIDLNESVDKLASNYNMNDEQITRLCEATNNAAFNALFEAKGKTGSDDRLVDFKVASAKEILQKRVAADRDRVRGQSKTAMYADVDMAWERRPLRGPVEETYEETKTAAEVPSASQLRRLEVQDANALEKAMEHLRIEKIGAEIQMQEALEDASRCFRSINTAHEFAPFEKEAMTLFGDSADALLDSMRVELRLPAVRRNYAKTASLFVVNEKTAAHKAFARAHAAQTRLANIQTTLARHGRG